jgi:hypothetical protein
MFIILNLINNINYSGSKGGNIIIERIKGVIDL